MIKPFPFYQQLDQMDCGPTCLRMIARYHGKLFSLNELRTKSFITREGVSLLGISEAAEAIGFRTVGVKVSFEKLAKHVSLPCIVHWNQSHFVVVYKVHKDKVYVADPAAALLVYKREEFEKSWLSAMDAETPVGLGLILEPTPAFYEQEEESDLKSKKGLGSLLAYTKQYKGLMAQLFMGLLVGSLIQLILPFLTQSIIDVGINTRNVNFIYLILAGQLMLFAGRTSVDLLRRWILLHVSTRINISILSDFLIKLLKLPLSFFDTKMIGDLLQRIDDYNRIERFLSTSTLNILFSFFNLFIFGIVLLFYNLKIFLVFFSFSMVYVLYTLLFLKKRAQLDYKRFQQLSQNQSNLIEMINGMPDIKLNNSETLKRWEWERIQAKVFKLNIASTLLLQYQDVVSATINELKNIIITVLAAMAVIDGQMTLGMMLAVQYIIGQLNAPLNEFISFSRDWQDAKLSYERIQEIHVLEDEETDGNSFGRNDRLPTGALAIERLSFQYEGPHSPKVIDGIDLMIPEGKVTAIVGSSGSGKTTLMKLLLKFYKPADGSIKVGEIKMGQIQASLWRSQCGVVMQDGYIFSDTIVRNIALSDGELDYDKIKQAVKVANIQEFIESLPLGYNTKIGGNGIGLSQGQKQRLLIA
ncbi:MAG: peptidase domain-containing ABC transporter, partial [Cyclobacteriaceae bacterium]|nr:peptidase domain-containing ABC transporter [Cyclobacteriaceae bacterium]